MAKKLTRTVFVDGVAYGPASAVPDDIAARITNPKAWVDADAPAPAPAGFVPATASVRSLDEPPSLEWTVRELKDFAKAQGIALGENRAKDQILAVLATAGHGPADDAAIEGPGDPAAILPPAVGDPAPVAPPAGGDPGSAGAEVQDADSADDVDKS